MATVRDAGEGHLVSAARDPSDQASGGSLLFLTDDLGGGTGNHLLSVAERTAAAGREVEVVSFAPRTARTDPDIRMTQLPPPSGPAVYPVHQMARFRQIRRLIRERRPDVVHAYFFWPILFARLLRIGGTVPRLVENREDEGFNWGRHEYAWLRLTRHLPDTVICVSEAVREVALRRERLGIDKTIVVHNGVDPPPDVPAEAVSGLRRELGIPAGCPVVGMVANLNRAVKGVGRFLTAVPDILAEVPETRFVVVGGGKDEAPLRQKVREEGLDDRVIIPGYREDVNTFYELMDVSVLSSYSEGLSITLLESMSHGLPVVATRVGGNPEVVVDDQTGHLVPVDRISELAARVIDLIEDNTARREMGEAARRRVETHFSMEEAAASYLRVYRQLL